VPGGAVVERLFWLVLSLVGGPGVHVADGAPEASTANETGHEMMRPGHPLEASRPDIVL
jgi:hypothetical protein